MRFHTTLPPLGRVRKLVFVRKQHVPNVIRYRHRHVFCGENLTPF
jgi:hypothetical protein